MRYILAVSTQILNIFRTSHWNNGKKFI